MSQQSILGVDYQNQPNFDAWWTPGWSSQNESYIPVPPNVFGAPGFPTTATYITVTGNFFDADANPLSGYLTFWPSTDLQFTVNGITTYIPQRRVGTNYTMVGINQFGSGKVYLWNGQLVVSLLATNCANMTPASFTYLVQEHWQGGSRYTISVPTTTTTNADIHTLIVGYDGGE